MKNPKITKKWNKVVLTHCYHHLKLPVNPNRDVNNQPEYEEFQQSFRESGYSYDMIKDRIVKQVEIVFEE